MTAEQKALPWAWAAALKPVGESVELALLAVGGKACRSARAFAKLAEARGLRALPNYEC